MREQRLLVGARELLPAATTWTRSTARGWLDAHAATSTTGGTTASARSTTTWRASAASGATRRGASAARSTSRASRSARYVGDDDPGRARAARCYRLYRTTIDTSSVGPAVPHARVLRAGRRALARPPVPHRRAPAAARSSPARSTCRRAARSTAATGARSSRSATCTSTSATTRRSSTASRTGLARFEPGAGGEFKHLRGFDARPTTACISCAIPAFATAVADYLVRERAAVRTEIDWLDERTALRRDREPEIE